MSREEKILALWSKRRVEESVRFAWNSWMLNLQLRKQVYRMGREFEHLRKRSTLKKAFNTLRFCAAKQRQERDIVLQKAEHNYMQTVMKRKTGILFRHWLNKSVRNSLNRFGVAQLLFRKTVCPLISLILFLHY